MPWENIGDVNTGDLPEDREWIEFCQKLAIQYLLFSCGKPPAGTSLEIMMQDHELGSYSSIALWYEFDAPWEYINKCEEALYILNDSIAWGDLKDHYEKSLESDDVGDESEYVDDYGDNEDEKPADETSDGAVVGTDSGSRQESPSDDFPIDDFATVGAGMLIDVIAGEVEYLPEDFYAGMKAEFGDVIDSHWQEIFVRSLRRRDAWLNELRAQKTNEAIQYEYGWDLSDEEIAEILGEESEDQKDAEEIEKELAEAEGALAENEELLREAAQKYKEIQHRIALELERVANGEGLEDASLPNTTAQLPSAVRRSDVDELGFYSHVYRTVESKMPNKASAEQVRSILGRDNGVKNEELEWLDMETFLRDNPHPSREHILNYVKAHNVRLEEVQLGTGESPDPHFVNRPFHLPGGENYREFVLTMPGQIESYEPDHIHFTEEGDGTAVVWARFDDRDGGETLHIAEIQSKRHQDGRDRGYRIKGGPALPLFAEVPAAPYKNANAWSMLMFKRMLRHAVENGYERITWDTGRTQTERYGLDEAGKRGMEAFYDELLVNNVNRFVRKWDARVVKANSENGWTIDAGTKGQMPVHSVVITDKMRGIVMDEGIPLFSILSPDE